MPSIKWTKDDVVKKFQEAITGSQPGGKPGVLQTLLDKAKLKIKPKPTEGEETV